MRIQFLWPSFSHFRKTMPSWRKFPRAPRRRTFWSVKWISWTSRWRVSYDFPSRSTWVTSRKCPSLPGETEWERGSFIVHNLHDDFSRHYGRFDDCSEMPEFPRFKCQHKWSNPVTFVAEQLRIHTTKSEEKYDEISSTILRDIRKRLRKTFWKTQIWLSEWLHSGLVQANTARKSDYFSERKCLLTFLHTPIRGWTVYFAIANVYYLH